MRDMHISQYRKIMDEIKFQCSCPVGSAGNSGAGAGAAAAPCDEISMKSILVNKAIPYLDAEKVTYEMFYSEHLVKNVPCMFSPGLTSNWFSCRKWLVEEDGPIHYDWLVNTYGDAYVNAVNCKDPEYKLGYGGRDCRDMKLKAYLLENFQNSCAEECLYLKDWHIIRFHKERNDKENEYPYQCPVYFQSDWLNEYCEDKNLNDYKFCYIGPQGSFTGFHADVYGSFSWSANVWGVKKWWLYPPGKEQTFWNATKHTLEFNWEQPGVEGVDYVEVVQKKGEAIFVPSGWHHVVWNMTEAISINHNWFNATNICYIWSGLQNALQDVERELEDIRDVPEFDEQCQIVLKANHGLDYQGFFDILKHIQLKRKKSEGWQAEFDYQAIRHCILEHCDNDKLVREKYFEQISELLAIIKSGSNSTTV